MTAMGVDVSGGGDDRTVIAARHSGWYAPLVRRAGKDVRDGSDVAAMVFRLRRDRAPVVIDVGGGYGGGAVLRLKDNGVMAVGFNGAHASNAKTRDGALGFVNRRAEAWWRMREELDPGQYGGSSIQLPPDASIKADLAAPRWHLRAGGIQLESKDEIRKRLGRSPDDGDAIVMAMSEWSKAAAKVERERRLLWNGGGRPERAVVGFADFKARFRG
jgi:hypothetical protein